MSRLLQVYEHEQLTVTFDARRCIHAAECVRHLPDVFAPTERPWVRPERSNSDAIVAAVHRCPTGALRVAINGERVEIADETVTVKVSRNGPLMLRGPIQVVDHTGEVLLDDRRMSLCRCGNSQRKPFCDGSHRTSGFRDPQPSSSESP